MDIDKKVRQVEKLYQLMEKPIRILMNEIPIRCPEGCGECCQGKNITAAPLEYLPLSWKYYREGILEEKYWALKENIPELCFLYQPNNGQAKGNCSEYGNRGIVCRLFGNAAITGKDGSKKFSGCKILKGQITDREAFNRSVQLKAPVYSDYYMRLRAIDNDYGAMLYPTNLAILKSMEMVWHSTRNKQKRTG